MKFKKTHIIGIFIILFLSISLVRGIIHLRHCEIVGLRGTQKDNCGQLSPTDVFFFFIPINKLFPYHDTDMVGDIYDPSAVKIQEKLTPSEVKKVY